MHPRIFGKHWADRAAHVCWQDIHSVNGIGMYYVSEKTLLWRRACGATIDRLYIQSIGEARRPCAFYVKYPPDSQPPSYRT